YNVPRIAFMNKMDRTGADFYESVKSMVDRLGAKPVLLQLPIGKESGFRGSVDLIIMKAILFDDETLGAKFVVDEISPDLLPLAQEYRQKMIEAVAEFDDQAMEKYIDGQALTNEEIKGAIRKGTLLMKITPVLTGASFKNKGVQLLLDAVVDYLPSPLDIPPVKGVDPKTETELERKPATTEPFAALAFKVMSDPY